MKNLCRKRLYDVIESQCYRRLKVSKRFVSVLLCLSYILTILVSCQSPSSETVSESTTASGIKVSGTAPSSWTGDGKIVSIEGYRIVYNDLVGSHIVQYIRDIDTKLGQKFEPLPYADVPDTENAMEIVVGDCARSFVASYKNDLKIDEYLIRYNPENQRIYIIGYGNQDTYCALRFFFETMLNDDQKSVTFPDDAFTYVKHNERMLASYKLNGVDIDDYTVVYPENADRLTVAAAENICDYFKAAMGANIKLSPDTVAESANEILVGDTNRDEDDISFAMADDQYAMFAKDTKIVFRGNGYMIGGGFGMLVKESIDPQKTKQAIEVAVPTEAIARTYVYAEICTNVILLIGDGMGYNHINMALDTGLIDSFAAQSLPNQGSAITRSQSVISGKAQFTDSAASGTALATGYKTYNGYVGVDTSGEAKENVRELAYKYGAKTAVVTTDVITGATPGAFLAHVKSREDSDAINSQIGILKNNGEIDYCKGTKDGTTAGILKKDTKLALSKIAKGADPFFIMIEEAYIDKHSYSTNFMTMRDCIDRFDEAIAYTISFALCHPGTALIVTADHETGGIIKASSLSDVRAAGVSEEKISQFSANMESDINNYGYCFTTYRSSGNADHTNVDVPVYAMGPGTEIFNNTRTENIDIARFIAKVYGAETFGQAFPVE